MKTRDNFPKDFTPVKRFARCEHGAITVVAIVFFATAVAIGGLAIDLGRLYGVHGQMQAYVDNIALAGGMELDGSPDSTVRAFRAVIGDNDGIGGGNDGGPLIDGLQNFAEGAAALSIDRVTFLSALGPDLSPIMPTPWPGDVRLCLWEGGVWTDPCDEPNQQDSTNAQFIEVVATERQVDYLILPIVDLFLGLVGQPAITDSATVILNATAGFKRNICNYPPLMMCNPNQATNPNDLTFTPIPGQQFLAKSQGAPQISPGNFGPLAIWQNGANAWAHGIASVNPNTVCLDDTVPSEPGAMTGPVEDGMNVRMDYYPNGPQFDSYPPARNVTKGVTQGPSCLNNQRDTNWMPPPAGNLPDTMPFPRHDCFGSFGPANLAECAGNNPRVSGGATAADTADWDRDLYWETNYNGQLLPDQLDNATRYEVYQYENNPLNNVPSLDGGESRAPMCGVPGPPDPDEIDRRVLNIAIVNCVATASNPALPNGRSNFPFIDVAEVFLTEPVGNEYFEPWSTNPNDNTTPGDIYIEMIGKLPPNSSSAANSGVLHVFPVLYR